MTVLSSERAKTFKPTQLCHCVQFARWCRKIVARAPHAGGRPLKMLESELWIHYGPAADPDAAEAAMLRHFAAHDPQRRQPLFFTSTGYARGAVDFADNAGIALFVYDAERGGLEAMNDRAKTLIHNGI